MCRRLGVARLLGIEVMGDGRWGRGGKEWV